MGIDRFLFAILQVSFSIPLVSKKDEIGLIVVCPLSSYQGQVTIRDGEYSTPKASPHDLKFTPSSLPRNPWLPSGGQKVNGEGSEKTS